MDTLTIVRKDTNRILILRGADGEEWSKAELLVRRDNVWKSKEINLTREELSAMQEQLLGF